MKTSNFLTGLILALLIASCTPKAMRLFNRGEERFKQEEFEFAKEDFKQSLSKGGPAAACHYYIAESYRKSNRIHESENHYKSAIDAGTKEEDAYFYYAKAMKANGNYEGASSQFKEYLKIGNNFDLINRAKAEIANLKILSEIANRKSFFEVSGIDELNTPSAEYSPILFNDVLYFTTSRGAEKIYAATGTGFTDIYEYIFDGVGEFTGQAKRLPKTINSENAHEASAVFSKDGKTMYFSRGNTGSKKGNEDVNLYMSKLVNGEWSEPVILEISDKKAWDSSPMLSPDGNTLYFSSNREGGLGGTDIYKATLNEEGKWSNVTNIGAPVNTGGNEMFPFLDEHGNFYFSSDGHPSLGGLDLFVATKNEDGKLEVKNLGIPVNSTHDDFAIFKVDSLTGYFSSNRPDGKGDDDIYKFIDNSMIRIAKYSIDGTSFGKDKTGDKHILANAIIKLVDEKGDTIASVVSDSLGKFILPVEAEKNYKIIAHKPSSPAYMKQTFELSTANKTVAFKDLEPGDNDIKIPFEFTLLKEEEKIIFVVDNIYYDFDKWNIRPDAAKELDKIVEFLANNPAISIELSSHTDERGAADYNRRLSQKRAQSAVEYIISKGIDKSRLTAKGYGKDKPLIKNAKTEEEHQKNRRTELEVTGIDKSKLEVIHKENQQTKSDVE
ncbi:MAG: OmpA family protein [Cytophagaceae bacterium]